MKHARGEKVRDLYLMAHDWIVNYDEPYLEIYKGARHGISKRKATSRAL